MIGEGRCGFIWWNIRIKHSSVSSNGKHWSRIKHTSKWSPKNRQWAGISKWRIPWICKNNGIAKNKTVRLTPQQNGLKERMNRTILETIKCMLSNANLSKCFLGEAVHTPCYLINRSPSAAIGFKTPEELWIGKVPSYRNLRTFGCTTYIHVDEWKFKPTGISFSSI